MIQIIHVRNVMGGQNLEFYVGHMQVRTGQDLGLLKASENVSEKEASLN